MNKKKNSKEQRPQRHNETSKKNKNPESKTSTSISTDNITDQFHAFSVEETSNDKFENETLPDFSSLIRNPISLGGHFKFKSEKEWDVAQTNKYSNYFSLNLSTLTTDLMAIPFYERHDIDVSLFTNKEIETMNKHLKLLKTLNKKEPTPLSLSKLEKEKTIESDLKSTDIPVGKNMPSSSNEKTTSIAQTDSDDVNLDEWLDEFLAS